MKKFFLGGIAISVIAVAMALNVNFSSKNSDLSDVFLANMEALAQNESGDGKGTLMDIIKNGEHVGNCCCPGTSSCGSSDCPSGACS